jgi:hypothetical protein
MGGDPVYARSSEVSLTQIAERQLAKRLLWITLVLIAAGTVVTLAAQPSSFWCSPASAIRFDGLPVHSTTNPMFDFFLGHGWLAYLAGVALYGAIIWFGARVLPHTLAITMELAVILGLCYTQSNWIVVRWHTGTSGAVLYIAGVSVLLTNAMLPAIKDKDREGERLRRLCWLMALTTTVDGMFTLLGQPASYWRNSLTVHEANPLAKFFLETGWWAYAAYIVALIAIPSLLSIRASRGTGWMIILGMTLGGLFGGSNWLFYERRLGLQSVILYGGILGLMIVVALLKFNLARVPGQRATDAFAKWQLWRC